RGDRAILNCADVGERLLCLHPGIMRWFVGQWEVRPATPGCNEQCGLSEIGGCYFWSDVRGRMLIIRLGISTDHGARSFTPGTTCALIHSGLRSGNSDQPGQDRKSTRLNSSHVSISYAVFCLTKK